MTLIDLRQTAGDRWADPNELLSAGLSSLDIHAAERRRAIDLYERLGRVLDEHWALTRGDDRVFSQGSFRLGTVTRRLGPAGEIDIDLVAMRDISRGSISQADLKAEVGNASRDFADRPENEAPQVLESDRCWTLSWPDMHVDVLPAIPSDVTSSPGLLITDKSLRDWQHSNPEGYADWFARRSSVERMEVRESLAKAQSLQVDDVPEWEVKTSLQRTVQALKRHRDLYFAERVEGRPSSIIITTLAAMAYPGRGPLLEVLQQVTSSLTSHLSHVDGTWWLANPVEASENFADYWAFDSSLPAGFFEWAEAAKRDFAELRETRGLDRVAEQLRKSLGDRVSRGALASAAGALTSARESGAVSVRTTPLASVGPVMTGRPARPNSFYGGNAQ